MNRKKDLELLCEVYSNGLLGEGNAGMKDYYSAQEQENADEGSEPGFAAQRMSGQMGTETHTGYVQQSEDQNPVQNYEGEEETPQERSGRMLIRHGFKRSEKTPKGNIIYTKADQPDAHVGTDGNINGKDFKLFFKRTGDQAYEGEENDQSLPQPEDTGINSNQNRGSWGSAAFGNESEEDHDEDIEMLVGKACPKDAGASDPTINPAALGGMVDIIAKALADKDEDEFESFDHAEDTDEADKKEFTYLDAEENAAARKQGYNPDENAEDAAAAMRADERENKKRLRAQDAVAKIYGFNPDADEEDGAAAAMKADERENKRNLKAQDKKARKFGFDPDEDEHCDEDEIDREKRYKERWGKDLDDEKEREGSSSAGAYTDVDKDDFCGPAGGAAPGTYPVNTRKRAIAAKSYARNAPDPEGIDRCVARKWPDLDEDEEKKGKYDDGDGKDERCDHVPCNEQRFYRSKGDRAMTNLMESYSEVINKNELL